MSSSLWPNTNPTCSSRPTIHVIDLLHPKQGEPLPPALLGTLSPLYSWCLHVTGSWILLRLMCSPLHFPNLWESGPEYLLYGYKDKSHHDSSAADKPHSVKKKVWADLVWPKESHFSVSPGTLTGESKDRGPLGWRTVRSMELAYWRG